MNAQTELFRSTAPFLGQGDLFCPVPPDGSRIVQACGLVGEGVMSPSAAVDEITIIGRSTWRASTDRLLDLLSEPRWPLRLVLAWIVHEGDAVRVFEAYDEARRWRLPLEARLGWRDAYRTLRHALASGTVKATARRSGSTLGPIAPEEWNALRPVVSGSVVILRKDDEATASTYSDVGFGAAAVKAHWKPVTRAGATSKATAKTEADALQSLTAIMRGSRKQPIAKSKIREQPSFKGPPARMFERIWAAAVTAAEAPAWRASGRRPKPRTSSPSSA